MAATKSVEEICQAIEHYRLMSSKDLATMRARWFRPDRKVAADPEQFRRWLVLNKYLTDFVARVVSGRKSDQLVLNQYRLTDQLNSGHGTAALFLQDPKLYNNADQALLETRNLIKAIRENPKRYLTIHFRVF